MTDWKHIFVNSTKLKRYGVTCYVKNKNSSRISDFLYEKHCQKSFCYLANQLNKIINKLLFFDMKTMVRYMMFYV
jgi:hypothetical protein